MIIMPKSSVLRMMPRSKGPSLKFRESVSIDLPIMCDISDPVYTESAHDFQESESAARKTVVLVDSK
jgi:hypothetical protein